MRRRGEIWLANLEPGHGAEHGKTSPVLVVQSQALLDADHPSTLVIPLTTKLAEDTEPLRIRVLASVGIDHESDMLIDQLRAIDNRRLVKAPIGMLPAGTMKTVDEAVREVLDLDTP